MQREGKVHGSVGRVGAWALAGGGPRQGGQNDPNRAWILLKPTGKHGPAWTGAKIAEAFGVGVRTVERPRRLLVIEWFEAALIQEPLPDRQYRKLDGTQEAELLRLAWSQPPNARAVDHATADR